MGAEAQLDVAFRFQRGYRNQGLGGVSGFPIWGVLAVFAVPAGPDLLRRLAAVAFMGGVPLFMTGLSLWMVLAYWRGELRIRGTRLVCRGVIKGQEIDLTQVTDAVATRRAGWRSNRAARRVGGIAIDFQNYEIEQRRSSFSTCDRWLSRRFRPAGLCSRTRLRCSSRDRFG